MSRLALPLLFGLLVTCTACSSNPSEPAPPPLPSIDGEWVGEVTSLGVVFPVEMTLAEEDTGVTGTGIVMSPQDTLAYTINGDHVHPLISLFLIFDRPPLGQVSGNVNDARTMITGTMNGPGFMGPVDLILTPRPRVALAP